MKGEDIEKLASELAGLRVGFAKSEGLIRDRYISLYEEMTSRLYEDDNHALHFKEAIGLILNEPNSNFSWSIAHHEISRSVSKLDNLRTPESVSVLVDLLSDQKGWLHVSEDYSYLLEEPNSPGMLRLSRQGSYPGQTLEGEWEPVAAIALRALNRMGVVNNPISESGLSDYEASYYTHNWIVPWQEWWQEVLAGERVFQFEGDPVRYNAEGPVGPDWQPRSVRRQKEKQLAGLMARSEEGKEPPSLANPWLKAAVALLLGAVLVFLGSRLRRGSSPQ
ncbi:hypothetical protein [Roseibacillus ishigakijimensis]|uniref:hypothetical protein n=1 Tax=Roseibacillus ishigakijimensis TaxID=454146 RepID=UPI00366F59B3